MLHNQVVLGSKRMRSSRPSKICPTSPPAVSPISLGQHLARLLVPRTSWRSALCVHLSAAHLATGCTARRAALPGPIQLGPVNLVKASTNLDCHGSSASHVLPASRRLTFDYQFVNNRDYNADRCPVNIFAAHSVRGVISAKEWFPRGNSGPAVFPKRMWRPRHTSNSAERCAASVLCDGAN